MVTGLAGALFAELNGFVSPSMLSWQRSGEIIVFVILGGVGRLFGPLAGAALFILLEAFVGGWTDRWQLVLGLVLLAVVLFARGGVVGLLAAKARHDCSAAGTARPAQGLRPLAGQPWRRPRRAAPPPPPTA